MKPTVGALKFAMLGNTACRCAIGTPSHAFAWRTDSQRTRRALFRAAS